jgi:hypothetical protein
MKPRYALMGARIPEIHPFHRRYTYLRPVAWLSSQALLACRYTNDRCKPLVTLTETLSENFKYLYLMFVDSPRFNGSAYYLNTEGKILRGLRR